MEPKVILAALVIVIIVSTLLYIFVFKKSDEPEIVIEEVEGPSPDTIDDVMTGGDDEPIPDEDETSLETAPADGEAEDEVVKVEGYMLKK
jgi:hypothetical protein